MAEVTTRYEKIERSKLWSLVQSGAEIYVIEMVQLKMLPLKDLTVSQIDYFYDDTAAFFVQAVKTEVTNDEG